MKINILKVPIEEMKKAMALLYQKMRIWKIFLFLEEIITML